MIAQEDWMNLQEYRSLADAGVPWTEIGRLAGCDPRTAKKYLTARPRPPRYGPRRRGSRLIDAFTGTIDAWLRASKGRLEASTIFERLVAEPYGFPGSYERVKEYVRVRRPEICHELGITEPREQMHRRFEVPPGSQAQVDWGEEGAIETAEGPIAVYSFHMVLAYSRDPFCRYTTSMDLATFWGCHIEAFDHFGGVPGLILYDRTKTVVRRHVGRGQDVPLHPEAVAFAAHYGFVPRPCWPYRPQTKGRVEKMVELTRAKVLAGRTFSSVAEMQAAWDEWIPSRRAQIHRTHGEVIAVRAETDRAALLPVPERPYLVCERYLRSVGKDALVHFDRSLYSVPWTKVRPRQRVELRVTRPEVAIYSVGASPEHLATHARAACKGSWVVDQRHWDGLPDGTRPSFGPAAPAPAAEPDPEADALARLMVRVAATGVEVARRDPATYDQLFGTTGGAR